MLYEINIILFTELLQHSKCLFTVCSNQWVLQPFKMGPFVVFMPVCWLVGLFNSYIISDMRISHQVAPYVKYIHRIHFWPYQPYSNWTRCKSIRRSYASPMSCIPVCSHLCCYSCQFYRWLFSAKPQILHDPRSARAI